MYGMYGMTRTRALAGLIALSMAAPLLGCSRSDNPVNAAPPAGAPYGYVPPPQSQPQKPGMSTGKKLAILAGAAALIYMYNKHKNSQGTGAQGKYYRSKNGRVYYRDARGNAVWVTPPEGGIQVPQDEAAYYQRAAQSGNWDAGYGGSGRMSSPSGPAGPGR